MAHVVVKALTRIHGLSYGEVATIELTPLVEALIENQKLAVVKDAEKPSEAEPAAKPARKRAAPKDEADAEDDAEDEAAKPAPRRTRRAKETPAPKER